MYSIIPIVSASICIHGYMNNNQWTFWSGICGLVISSSVLISIVKYDRIAPSKSIKKVMKTREKIKLIETNTKDINYKNQYVNLSYGRCYVEQWKTNKKDGYHMLTVHGFSMPDTLTIAFIPFIINNITNINSIKSITSFHLYGRGLSDAPLLPYTMSLFLSQISEIMTYFELDGPIILCGLSMGGAIIAEFANKYPHRIHKLCMFAPAGITSKIPFIGKLLLLPLIGELLMNIAKNYIKKGIKNGITKELNVNKYGDEAKKALEKHLFVSQNQLDHHDGYLYALISTVRYFPMTQLMDTFNNLYERDDFNNKRWIFIWSDNDNTCPIKQDSLFPNIKILKLSGYRHCEIIETYCIKQYAQQFIQWLNEQI